MKTEDVAGGSSQREMTAEELRLAARMGDLIGATTPGAPLGVIAPEGLPRATTLVGREEGLERALATLTDGEAPAVITISGPSGAGKTALAAEVVAQAGERELFPGGVIWLSCDEASGDAGLETTLGRLARAIGAEGEGPASLEQRQAALHDALHAGEGPRLLLALDSVEPTLDTTALLDTLAGGRAALLITARQSIQDERACGTPLAPLDATSAAGLLRQRLLRGDPARLATEDDPLIAEAATTLGGLPLAIGLAASFAAVMRLPLDQIAFATREDDTHEATVNMRALLDRAWAALPPMCRLLLAGLALIDGATFPRGVALAVAGAALHSDAGEHHPKIDEAWRQEAATALDALIGLHLVDALAAGRLRLHVIIRRYAAERLREEPEETPDVLGAAMADWWLDYARAHQGIDDVAVLDAEAVGIMGAIAWAHAHARHSAVRDLAHALSYTWQFRGSFASGRQIRSWTVAAARALDDLSGLRAALQDLARFDARAGRVVEARAGFAEALRLARDLGDEQAAAMARRGLSELEREP